MEINPFFNPVRHSSRRFYVHWLRLLGLAWLIQILISPCGWAQPPQPFINELVPIDGESGDVVYMAVVAVGGASTTQLYNRAHHFLAQTVHVGSLLPIAHPSKHHISQCGIITLPHRQSGQSKPQDYRVTIELTVKAGKYRYRLSQFRAHPDSVGNGLPIREMYLYDKQRYGYGESTVQQLRAWDRSVRTYLSQLHEYMLGSHRAEYDKPL